MAGALVACRPAGSVSVMVIGPEGLQEKSTEILNSNPEPACTVVGPLFTASKQSCRERKKCSHRQLSAEARQQQRSRCSSSTHIVCLTMCNITAVVEGLFVP